MADRAVGGLSRRRAALVDGPASRWPSRGKPRNKALARLRFSVNKSTDPWQTGSSAFSRTRSIPPSHARQVAGAPRLRLAAAQEDAMARHMPTGSRIRERRMARGLRQAELAKAAGISPSYLNLIEHNRRRIGGALLGRIAAVLETERQALTGEGDAERTEALRAVGAARGLAADALDQAAEVARLMPAWGALVLEQAGALAAQARTIEALSDRVANDPALAEAMHELLSSVSVVRSTASILAGTPELDPTWLARFHANLDADSRRLAQGAEAVASYFEREARPEGAAALLPAEEAAAFLDAHDHAFPALEEEGASAIPRLVASLSPAARAPAEAALARMAKDAARLPAGVAAAAREPDDLIELAGGDLALVLRRMAVAVPGRALAVVDASGALLLRKAVPGFPLPVLGAGCPLWPVFVALARPQQPLRAVIEMPDGATWRADAVAAAAAPPRLGGPPVMRATMLLRRPDAAGAPPAARPWAVGPGCRTCPRAACDARREASILSQSAPADAVPAPRVDRPRPVEDAGRHR
jgi:transcriptional regulator with XRE-family HTH domain